MRLLVRRSIFLALIGVAMFWGCDDTTEGPAKFEAEEAFDVTVTRGVGDARTSLTLRGVNGTVRITGSPTANTIRVTGTRRVESHSLADAEAHLAQLQVAIDSTGTGVVVETIQPAAADGRDYTVDYEIALPEVFALTVQNANGDVAVNSMQNGVVVLCANGRVLVSGIEADTDIAVGNGAIDASVVLPPGGRIILDVANGAIDLEIPTDTSAEFSAEVANGSIALVGLVLSDEVRTPTSLQGTLGGGDGTITLAVANGTIVVEGF
jgi:hypothetical protein